MTSHLQQAHPYARLAKGTSAVDSHNDSTDDTPYLTVAVMEEYRKQTPSYRTP